MLRVILAIALTLLLAAAAFADSLWTATSTSFLADGRTRTVGEIISVAVVESVSTSHAADHETKKSSNVTATAGTGLLQFLPALGVAAERDSEGSGASTMATSITDHISVTVTAIDAHGNLTVAGDRTMQLGSDTLKVHFAGHVRPQDIDQTNTVLSTSVADLCVTWTAQGPIAEKQKPGLVQQLLHWLW